MTLNKIKPHVEEINGIRCVVVERHKKAARADFLHKLLTHNGYQVETTTDEGGLVTIGVTDLLFNPVLDVYKRRLRSLTDHKVTPAYWLQKSDHESGAEVSYW